ncbi:MAG: hypothetical protein WCJ64_20295 [Rhodospirillaceae bacterium]
MATFQKRFQPWLSQPPPPPPPAAAPPPVPNTAERVEVLITVNTSLAALLARECDAANRRALAEVAALQDEKRRLAQRFDEIGRLVRLDKAGLAALPPELMARLKESSWRLAEATSANVQALDIQAAARKSVIDVVVKAVNHQRLSEAAYAGCRQGYPPKITRAPPGRALSLNATL